MQFDDDSDEEDGLFRAGAGEDTAPPPSHFVPSPDWASKLQPPPSYSPQMPIHPEPQQTFNDPFQQVNPSCMPMPLRPPVPQPSNAPGSWQQQQPPSAPKDEPPMCGLDPRSWPQGSPQAPGRWSAMEGKGWPQMQRGPPPPQMPPTSPPSMPPQMQGQPQMPPQMQGQQPMQPMQMPGGYCFIPIFTDDPMMHGCPMQGASPMRPDDDSGFDSGFRMDNNLHSRAADLANAHMQAQMHAQAFQQQQAKGGKGDAKGWMPMPPEMQQQQMFAQQMGQAQKGWQQQGQQQLPQQMGQMGKGQGQGSRNRQQMPPGQDDWSDANAHWRWTGQGGMSWQHRQDYQANQQQSSDGWQRSQPSKRNNRKGQNWMPGEGYDDKGGFDKGGFDKGGFDKGGFDKGGFDKGCFGKGGFNKGGYDKGGFRGKANFGQEAFQQQQRQMAADIAQPRGKQGSGGLARTLREVGKPSIPPDTKMRAGKAKLRHENSTEQGKGAGSSTSSRANNDGHDNDSRGKGKHRQAPAPGRSLRVSWVLPSDVTGAREAVVQGEGEEECRIAKELEGMDFSDVKAVLMRLENSVAGCQVTVNLNGESSILNSSGFGKKGLVAQEKRFKISPLSKSAESDQIDCGADVDEFDTAVVEEPPATDTVSRETPIESSAKEEREDQEKQETDDINPPEVTPEVVQAASESVLTPSESILATQRRRSSAPVAPAAFAATVTLDTSEVQAKTTQELIDPDVEVVDIFDTAAVLRMTDLTGDRFELTVYAGSSDNAATLVHRGPIKSSESVHRIGQLEPSQVYVAWVRVFCESEVRESKQKGFKTLPARVKTIWDEPDHVILGVSKDATAKEITKAFRQKSLQCHPDKETDPEKKDAAEEHMKRLNLAKQNMMRCAPKDQGDHNEPDTPAADPEAPPTPAPDMPPNPSPFFGQGGSGFESGDDTGSDMDTFWKPRNQQSPKARHPNDPAEQQPPAPPTREEGSLCCSLRIEAAKPPKLQVIERGLTTLSINASGLPLAGTVEVQKFEDGVWQAALPAVKVTAETMRFTLTDLQENSSYRLRLRTTIELEPLRFAFAQFADCESPKALSEPMDEDCEEEPPIFPTSSTDKGKGNGRAGEADDEDAASEHEQDVLESEEELDHNDEDSDGLEPQFSGKGSES